MTSGPTAALCAALYDQARQGIPDHASQTARAVMLDGVGCLFAGFAETPSKISREYVATLSSRAESSVLGVDRQVGAADAAFANGVAMHSLDFEALGSPPCHGTATILPALLALAERGRLSGRAVISALVLGWEVECRLRSVGELREAFHPMAVYGPVATGSACAVLLGLEPLQIQDAIAIAASCSGGLAANGRAPVKVVHAGNAARSGVLAALQAQDGLTGTPSVFERQGGFGDAFFRKVDWDRLPERWGESYFLSGDNVTFKPYPVQLPMTNVIDAVLDARAPGFDPAELESLEITGSPVVVSRSNPRPAHGHAGKFSPEYCAAVALVFGEVGIESFTDEMVADPRIKTVIERVTLVERSNTLVHEVSVRVTCRGGDVRAVTRDHQRGSKWAPLSREERIAKVCQCLAHAGVGEIADQLVALVDGFDTAQDVTALGRLLRRQVAEPPAWTRV